MLKSLLAIVLTFALTTLVLAQGGDSTPDATERVTRDVARWQPGHPVLE